MNFTKKTNILLFALLVILNIVFRLPVTTHEIGVDSFFIHNLATTISTFGYAGWTIHPLSFAGLYPISYASAVPFFLSGTSQITGITIEYIILFLCILLGVISVLFTFLFAKEVKNDDLFAFLVSFIYSLSPVFLAFTIWQATTRNMFMAFFPLFLWALLRCWKSFSAKSIVIVIILTIILLCTHRLSLFVPLIFIAFIAAVILMLIYQKIKQCMEFSNSKIPNILAPLIFLIAFLLLFSVQFSGLSFYDKWLPSFYSGYLFEGEATYIVILNLAADYFGKAGFILFFGLIGFIYLARTAFNDFGRLFVVLSVLALTPLLVMEIYTPELIISFFSILIGFGLINTYDFLKQRRRITFSILGICLILVVSTGFSWFILDHWHMHTGDMSDKTCATASFLGSEKVNGTSVANSGRLGSQIAAFSGEPCLPYGGVYSPSYSPEQLVYGSVRADEVVIGELLSPSEIISSRRLYKLKANISNANRDWSAFLTSFPWVNKTKILSAKYDAHYVIENVNLYGEYYYWKKRYSRLLFNLHESGNKIYVNGKENIWHLS